MNMHHVVQEGLEDFLAGTSDRQSLVRIEAHLKECAECRQEVELMREMSGLFSCFRSPDPSVPAPGFYARVNNLIEQQQSGSFWAGFLEPVFGKRVALASLLLLAAFGTVLMSRETEEYADRPQSGNDPGGGEGCAAARIRSGDGPRPDVVHFGQSSSMSI